MICSTHTRIAILLAVLSWTNPTVAAAVDPTPVPICWGTEIENWQARMGSFSLDREEFKSRESSIRFEESGIYEMTAAIEPFSRISVLALVSGDQAIRIDAYLRDRGGVKYDFHSLTLAPLNRWEYFDLGMDALFLPQSSVDPNHRFDFPGTVFGFEVKIPAGGKLNIDRIRTDAARKDNRAGQLMSDRLARWDDRLRRMAPAPWRTIPAVENPPTRTESRKTIRVKAAHYTAYLDAETGALTRLEFGPDGSKPLDLFMKPVWEVVT
jgi:hypothetical protein